MIDLSLIGGTLTNKVESLIPQMEKMEYMDLKATLHEILFSQDTTASKETRKKWLFAIDRKKSKNDLMMMVTNLYLAGCDLKTLK
jgi:NADPH-dependent 7-cyano-7-deazaguanine reductase QueF-like protein